MPLLPLPPLMSWTWKSPSPGTRIVWPILNPSSSGAVTGDFAGAGLAGEMAAVFADGALCSEAARGCLGASVVSSFFFFFLRFRKSNMVTSYQNPALERFITTIHAIACAEIPTLILSAKSVRPYTLDGRRGEKFVSASFPLRVPIRSAGLPNRIRRGWIQDAHWHTI